MTVALISSPSLFIFAAPKGGQLPIIAWLAELCDVSWLGFEPSPTWSSVMWSHEAQVEFIIVFRTSTRTSWNIDADFKANETCAFDLHSRWVSNRLGVFARPKMRPFGWSWWKRNWETNGRDPIFSELEPAHFYPTSSDRFSILSLDAMPLYTNCHWPKWTRRTNKTRSCSHC